MAGICCRQFGRMGVMVIGVEILLVFRHGLIGQWHGHLVASGSPGDIALVAEIVEGVVAHLAVGDLHRGMVDAVVAVVVDFFGLVDADAVCTDEGTLIPYGVGRETLRQVDDLAHLSVLEQCGIALAIHLLHLPSYGRQHQHIFAGHRVGPDDHALALHVGYGLVALAARVVERELP